jgi:nicotinamide mononucleotide (NMN) deamidase PncC
MFEKGIITFDSNLKEEMLAIFGKVIDKQGFIIDEHSKKREVATDGKEIRIAEFAGIMKGKTEGSIAILRNDLITML